MNRSEELWMFHVKGYSYRQRNKMSSISLFQGNTQIQTSLYRFFVKFIEIISKSTILLFHTTYNYSPYCIYIKHIGEGISFSVYILLLKQNKTVK